MWFFRIMEVMRIFNLHWPLLIVRYFWKYSQYFFFRFQGRMQLIEFGWAQNNVLQSTSRECMTHYTHGSKNWVRMLLVCSNLTTYLLPIHCKVFQSDLIVIFLDRELRREILTVTMMLGSFFRHFPRLLDFVLFCIKHCIKQYLNVCICKSA